MQIIAVTIFMVLILSSQFPCDVNINHSGRCIDYSSWSCWDDFSLALITIFPPMRCHRWWQGSEFEFHYGWSWYYEITLFFLTIAYGHCWWNCTLWWRHQMETFSSLLALCAGNSPVTGEFPTHSPVPRSFDVFFDLRLNQQLSKQWRRRWFETPSRSLWRHWNDEIISLCWRDSCHDCGNIYWCASRSITTLYNWHLRYKKKSKICDHLFSYE